MCASARERMVSSCRRAPARHRHKEIEMQRFLIERPPCGSWAGALARITGRDRYPTDVTAPSNPPAPKRNLIAAVAVATAANTSRHAPHNPSRLGSSHPPRLRLPHPETRLEPPPAATLRGAAHPAPSPPEHLGSRRSGDAQPPRHGRSTQPKSIPPHTLCAKALQRGTSQAGQDFNGVPRKRAPRGRHPERRSTCAWQPNSWHRAGLLRRLATSFH